MASSRPLRGRRHPSPQNSPLQARMPIKTESTQERNDDMTADGWDEPAPRTPVASFEDHKGLERQGVLEHMAPLGHLPGQKLKTKMKQQEPPPRRTPQVKNGEARGLREEANFEQSTPPVTSRRTESRKQEVNPRARSSRGKDEDGEYDPKQNRAQTAKHVPIQPATNGTSTPRPTTQEGRFKTIPEGKLKTVVEKAARRSAEIGNPSLGLAIKKMYDESLHNQQVADLLDAVLTQKQTNQQAIEFQQYVKTARRQIKLELDTPTNSMPKSASNSPKIGRTTDLRQSSNLNDTSNAPGIKIPPFPVTHKTASEHHSSNMKVNGSSSKDGRRSKRKRGSSASSDSPLSSLGSVEDSGLEQTGVTPVEDPNNRPPPQRTLQAGPKSSAGSRIGSFPPSKLGDSAKRPASAMGQSANDITADELASKRRKLLQEHSYDYQVAESNVRPVLQDVKPAKATPRRVASPAVNQPQSRLRNGTVQRNRRYNDDDDDDALSSPPSSPGDLLVPPPDGAWRGGTPNQLGRPPKAVKKAARIKMSPMKKRNGVTAGIARQGDVENTSLGYRRFDDSNEHENADACAACSGNGQLLCCDGCERAFHFTCLDPPFSSEKPPTGEWYCPKCLKGRLEFPTADRGVFRELDNEVVVKNPSAFNLPFSIRDYFDGVKTGEEGEYEEPPPLKTSRSRSGYEDNTNNLKLKDGKENTLLCFQCSLSSMGNREIISCDFCSCSWHLDCLDPPLATAPNKSRINGKPRPMWMCPNHIDHELAHIEPPAKKIKKSSDPQAPASRTHKIRKPRNATTVNPALRRGIKNYGLIEIENEPSDEESDVEREMNGAIYRVPEKGLKLDFIDRINRMNQEEALAKLKAKPRRSKSTQTTEAVSKTPIALEDRPFSERKAAINLVQLAQNDPILDSDKVQNLIQTLTAEAPQEVESLVTAAEKTEEAEADAPLTDQERSGLQTIINIANRLLENGK